MHEDFKLIPLPPVTSGVLLGALNEIPLPDVPEGSPDELRVELTKEWSEATIAKLIEEKGAPEHIARAAVFRAVALQIALHDHGLELAEMEAIEVRGVGKDARLHWSNNLTAIFAQSPMGILHDQPCLPWETFVKVWERLKTTKLIQL